MVGYLKPAKGAQPVMLLLADALSPKGQWCGPYVQSATAGWCMHPQSKRYVPYYDKWEPHARKFLGVRPYDPATDGDQLT